MVEADPMDGLHAFAVIPMSATYKKAEDVYKNIQAGFGYTIEGVGKLKAQFIGDYNDEEAEAEATTWALGNKYDDNGNWVIDDTVATAPTYGLNTVEAKNANDTTGQIGVAFDITAIENLYVTVGARFGIADKDCRPDYLKMAFTAGASYQVSEQMKFSVDGGYVQYQDDCVARDGELVDNVFFVGAGVDYAIMDGLSLAADVRYMSNAKSAKEAKDIKSYGKDGDEGAISFLIGVNKSVGSNGSIGVGFQGATNGCGFTWGTGDDIGGLKANAADDFVWAIPVSVSVTL